LRGLPDIVRGRAIDEPQLAESADDHGLGVALEHITASDPGIGIGHGRLAPMAGLGS
jgi:hypothetical protein